MSFAHGLGNNLVKQSAQFIDPRVVTTGGHMFNDRELSRAFRQAIAAEEEAIHLYEFIADSTVNEKAKKTMQDIADEEKVHVGEIQEVLKQLLSDEQKHLDEGAAEVND